MSNSTETQSTGGNGGLYFIVGILVAVVAGLVFFMYGGEVPDAGGEGGLNVTIESSDAAPAGGGDGGAEASE